MENIPPRSKQHQNRHYRYQSKKMNSFSKKSPPGLQKSQKKTHNNPIPQFSFLIDNYLINLTVSAGKNLKAKQQQNH